MTSADPGTVREMLAADFRAEGVDAVFGLMGDGNMAWMATMAAHPDVRVVHARYEGAAVAMADGYARATGRLGVASVTCGPGVTQIVTSLTAAARRGAPLVVLAGDTPLAAAYHLQALDQGPVVRSAGAGHIRVETAEQAVGVVARVCHRARAERRPVVLSVPYDLQEQRLTAPVVRTPRAPRPDDARLPGPHPQDVADLAALLAEARHPVLLAGAGALAAGCRDDIVALASRVGARMATTLRAKGWFDGEPADLGVAGGFGSDHAREECARADVVLALGARLAHHTTDGGTFFPAATVAQVDLAPDGLVDGARVADVLVRADAGALVRALLADGRLAGERAPEAAPTDQRPVEATPVAAGPADPVPEGPTGAEGMLDPQRVAGTVDDAVPPGMPLVVGVGHFWNFIVPALHGRAPSRLHFTYDFGVIGQALPTGMGIAVAERAPTVVVEGDGSLLMNVQELETLARHRLPVLIVCVDDGAYGAEYHKLPATGADPELAVFGWVALDEVAAAFGLRAARPCTLAGLHAAIDGFVADPLPTLLDVRVDVRALSPQFRRRLRG